MTDWTIYGDSEPTFLQKTCAAYILDEAHEDNIL